MCEPGLRRHKQANQERETKDKIGTALVTQTDHCEEEGEAGERMPSSPQIDVLPVAKRRKSRTPSI